MHYQTNTTRTRRLGLAFMVAIIAALAALVSLLPASGSSLPAPTNVTVTIVSTGLQVSWDAPDTSDVTLPGQLLNYKIERQPGLSSQWAVLVDNTGSTLTTYTDTSGSLHGRFVHGLSYSYRITAVYDNGSGGTVSSAASTHGFRVTGDMPRPTGLDRDEDDDGVQLSWNAPDLSDHPETDASHTGYELRGSGYSTNLRVVLDSDVTSYTHSDGEWLDVYQIIAVYGVFESRTEYFPRGVQPDVPAPTGLGGSALSTGLKVTWAAPDTTDMSVDADLEGYEIQRVVSGTDYTVLEENTRSASTQYLDADPGAGSKFLSDQDYTYRIIAVYKDNRGIRYRSAPSSGHAVTVPSYIAPGNFTASDSNNSIALDWDPPTMSWNSNMAGLSGYRLTVTEPSETVSWWDFLTGTTAYTYTTDEVGEHKFEVAAFFGIFSSDVATTTFTNTAVTSTDGANGAQ